MPGAVWLRAFQTNKGIHDMKKEYLGDAVYAEVSKHDDLVLTTEDGYRATNTIVLEPLVLEALETYLKARRAEVAREEESTT